LAAKQLDELWDGQVSILNPSYQKTLDALAVGKQKEASAEFHASFTPAVKKLFSEASQTYPERFKGVDDWCGWIKGLYNTTMKADKALAGGNVDQANALMLSLRESFYTLREQTKTLQTSDIVFALEIESQKANPDASQIKSLTERLAESKLSPKAQGSADDFLKAKSDYTTKVNPIVADQKIEGGELPELRSATQTLYKAYGTQLE
jgi:hypothetical protein